MYSFFNDATNEIISCADLKYLYKCIRSNIRADVHYGCHCVSYGTIYKHEGETPERETPVCHFRSFAEFPTWYEGQMVADLDLTVRTYNVLRRRVDMPATVSGVVVNSNLRSLYEISRMLPSDTGIRNYGSKCATDLRRALSYMLSMPIHP